MGFFGRWVDDHLVHLLSPNIYRSPTEALEAFGYIAESGELPVSEGRNAILLRTL